MEVDLRENHHSNNPSDNFVDYRLPNFFFNKADMLIPLTQVACLAS